MSWDDLLGLKEIPEIPAARLVRGVMSLPEEPKKRFDRKAWMQNINYKEYHRIQMREWRARKKNDNG